MSDLIPDPNADPLTAFINYANRLDSIMRNSVRPAAYAETCCCGATVEIGSEVDVKERRQLARHFIARHQHCTQPGRNADWNATEEASP